MNRFAVAAVALVGLTMPALAQSPEPGSGIVEPRGSSLRQEQPTKTTTPRTTTERLLPRTASPDAGQPSALTDRKF